MIGKRVIDIDEANFMEASFVRKAWGHRNQPLRPLKMPLGHSMSLIAAVDNYGASFFALVHGIIYGKVFAKFLQHLVIDLVGEDSDWRDNKLLVKSNKCIATKQLAKLLRQKPCKNSAGLVLDPSVSTGAVPSDPTLLMPTVQILDPALFFGERLDKIRGDCCKESRI